MNTPENIAKDPDDPQAADNTFQMEYSFNKLYSPSIREVTKKLPYKLSLYRYHQIIWNIQ